MSSLDVDTQMKALLGSLSGVAKETDMSESLSGSVALMSMPSMGTFELPVAERYSAPVRPDRHYYLYPFPGKSGRETARLVESILVTLLDKQDWNKERDENRHYQDVFSVEKAGQRYMPSNPARLTLSERSAKALFPDTPEIVKAVAATKEGAGMIAFTVSAKNTVEALPGVHCQTSFHLADQLGKLAKAIDSNTALRQQLHTAITVSERWGTKLQDHAVKPAVRLKSFKNGEAVFTLDLQLGHLHGVKPMNNLLVSLRDPENPAIGAGKMYSRDGSRQVASGSLLFSIPIDSPKIQAVDEALQNYFKEISPRIARDGGGSRSR